MDEIEAKYYIRKVVQEEIDRCFDISECSYDRHSRQEVEEATFLLKKLIEAKDLIL